MLFVRIFRNFQEKGLRPPIDPFSRNTPLHLACELGRPDLAEILVSREEANVNARGDGNATPLHVCCRQYNQKNCFT